MTAQIRLAIVGAGLVGRRHADALRGVAGVTLASVVDPDPATRAFAEARGARWFGSLSALFAADRPDGVVLSTPTPLHAEQGLECVARGLPVLIEKPIAAEAGEAEALTAAAEAAGVPLLVGHHRRHNPLIQKAVEMIRSGAIGRIRAVNAQCWFYKPDAYFDAAPWRKRRGAGPISVNLAHDVDLLRHLCGEVVAVQAQAAPSARGYENEDVAAALLTFQSGAIGAISVSDAIAAPWSWEMTARENPIYPPTSQSCYMIGGSEGALSIPDLTLWRHEGAPDWWRPMAAVTPPRAASDPLVNQIAHFRAVILGEAEPLVSGAEGLRTLRVIEAIQRAAASGEVVRLA